MGPDGKRTRFQPLAIPSGTPPGCKLRGGVAKPLSLCYTVAMSQIEFREWPKIFRLNREIIVTEKIDGTNACIIVEPAPGSYRDGLTHIMEDGWPVSADDPRATTAPGVLVDLHGSRAVVAAQSRKRVISPGSDNFGFARWVRENATELANLLGYGYHFGEWYGSGIQRGYGLQNGEKRFMLFNVDRWSALPLVVPGLEVATVLYRGNFYTDQIEICVGKLKRDGSYHVKGFDNPEGVIVYHTAGNTSFKVTCEKDERHKGETTRGHRKDF
jgi:hypothetical protein